MTIQQIINSKSVLLKYNDGKMAIKVANRSVKPQSVILGDDGKYWVCSRAIGEKLHRAGYDYSPIK